MRGGRHANARAGLAALVILLAACSAASPTPSVEPTDSGAPSPTATPSPDLTPSPTPTSSPAATPAPPTFQNQALARVLVDGLNVRTAPSGSAPRQTDVTGAPLGLGAGDEVLVLGGPDWADGNWWVIVALSQDSGLYAAPIPVGWAAAGTGDAPWIEANSVGCGDSSVENLADLQGIVRVACYSSAPFTFDARIASEPPDGGLGGACDVADQYPRWLLCDHINYNWVNVDGGTDWLLQLHFDPDTGVAPTGLADVGTTGAAIRITAHYDDPASDSCVTASLPGSLDGLSQRLTCAAKLVVDAIQYR